MTQKEMDKLPELELYRVDAPQIAKFSPLFTQEAVAELAAGTAAAMIAVEENVACGGICMKPLEGEQEGMLELLSLYVVPEYRRRGVAGTLFLEMMENIFEATDGILHTCRYLGEKDGNFPDESEGTGQSTVKGLPGGASGGLPHGFRSRAFCAGKEENLSDAFTCGGSLYDGGRAGGCLSGNQLRSF